MVQPYLANGHDYYMLLGVHRRIGPRCGKARHKSIQGKFSCKFEDSEKEKMSGEGRSGNNGG